MKEYDLMVIGGGPGGYVAAIRAAQLGMKTALIEERELGGTCLNRGCIPTKALLHSSAVYAECAHFDALGLSLEGVSYDMEKIHGRKAQVVAQLRGGVEQLLRANGVEVISGRGSILAPGKVSVAGEDYGAKSTLVATGSVPACPPIPGLDLSGVVTSDEILEGEPRDYRSLIIIGGGVIGVEMASVYANLGCEVTVIEAMDRILPTMDKEISQNLATALKKKGIGLHTGAKVERVEAGEAGLRCHFISKEKGEIAEAEGVLVSIGRRPNLEGLFDSELAPERERGFLVVDERYQTSLPGVYAVGDVIGGVQLAHKAEAEGMAAVEMLCGHVPATDPKWVPACIYTDPEIASVGMTVSESEGKRHRRKDGQIHDERKRKEPHRHAGERIYPRCL